MALLLVGDGAGGYGPIFASAVPMMAERGQSADEVGDHSAAKLG